jgi:hypothetical protein
MARRSKPSAKPQSSGVESIEVNTHSATSQSHATLRGASGCSTGGSSHEIGRQPHRHSTPPPPPPLPPPPRSLCCWALSRFCRSAYV